MTKPPPLTLTPPEGHALSAIGAPITKDPRQVAYERQRREWRALHPHRNVKDFAEDE